MKQSASAGGSKGFYSSKQFKISVLTLGLIFFSNAGYSQRVTLTELISKTKCTDFTCYNDFITAKGFCYENTDKNQYGLLYRFSSCDFIKDGPKGVDTKNQSSIMMMNTGSISADVGTSSKAYRQILLLELTKLGFKAYETDNSEGNMVYVQYRSKIYPKINALVTTAKLNKDDMNWAYWSVSMRRDQ